MHASAQRLYFLDWVRILAFFLLVLYHTGMYYVSWDWHVKSPFTTRAIEPLMMLSAPWRMGLLFVIGGVAARFLLSKLGSARFVRIRSVRLLVPLLFGMLIIVPPQPYFEVVEKVAYTGSYADFMRLYLSAYGDFCRGDDCLLIPTWNHLWFLPYLWSYSVLLALGMVAFGGHLERLGARLGMLLAGWRAIALPALFLGLPRVLLADRFETTHALVDDWYSHAVYLSLFLLGALLADQRRFWDGLVNLRWPALGIALCCWAAAVIFYALPYELRSEAHMAAWTVAIRMSDGLCSWSAIVAVCAFAQRHLNHDSEARRYLTEAVFPVYILHQTLIVTITHLIKPAGITPAVEALLLIVLTLCLSFGAFAIVRRVALLRPLFGLGPERSAASTANLTSQNQACCEGTSYCASLLRVNL